MKTHKQTPLCVDLDKSLLKTDSLWEGINALLRRKPRTILATLLTLRHGRAAFKIQIANSAEIDVSKLPINPQVANYVDSQIQIGREVFIVTGAPETIARSVANQMPGIKDVFATNSSALNLTSHRKAEFLASRFGIAGFDYIGDSAKDIPVWMQSQVSYGVNVPKRVQRQASSVGVDLQLISQRRFSLSLWFKQLRVHQAVKNFLVFVPLLLAHQLLNVTAVLLSIVAFVSFTLVSFGTYIWNDLRDIDADRNHPSKRKRPLAAGDISIGAGMAVSCLLVALGFTISSFVSLQFSGLLLLYVLATIAYSSYLKFVAIADVIVLAALFTLRILAGAIAIDVPLSIWVALTSVFLFFSLALMKRYSEFVKYGREVIEARGYQQNDRPVILGAGLSSGVVSILVIGLYLNSNSVADLYQTPEILWALLPVLLFWITRMWVLTERGSMEDDPVAYAVTDRVSLAIALCTFLIIFLATLVNI
jgi:4-hydroxybenzoate polyprenyltransferase/phosphoserine phosphatase